MRRGGDLLKVTNSTVHDDVVDLLNDVNTGEEYTWVGVTKREYIWMSGKTTHEYSTMK